MGDSLEHLYELPKTGHYGSTIEWDIDENHPSNLNEGILYNYSSEDIYVTLYAIFWHGDAISELQKYEVMIYAADYDQEEDDEFSDEAIAAYYSTISSTQEMH